MLTTILIALVAVPLGVHLATTRLALLHLRRREDGRGTRPFVSLVRPVCGAESEAFGVGSGKVAVVVVVLHAALRHRR